MDKARWSHIWPFVALALLLSVGVMVDSGNDVWNAVAAGAWMFVAFLLIANPRP